MYRRLLIALEKLLLRIYGNCESAIRYIRNQLYFLDFEERESDVYVVTYLKSGTTWMQVILYNMLTDGDMNFDHIYDVSPWPKNQAFKNEPVEKINQMPSPRILKSHESYEEFDASMKGKIVYVYRDGKDVAVSLYHHNKNYLDPDATLDGTFEEFFTKEKAIMNWFKFNAEWLENKNNLQILYVTYQQLSDDFENTILRIGKFLNTEITPERYQKIKEHSSFEFMKANEQKFGEVPAVKSQKVYNEFIRKGKSGEGERQLQPERIEYYNKKYQEYIKPFIKKFHKCFF